MPKASALPHLKLNAAQINEDFHRLTPAALSPRSIGSPHTPGSIPGSPYLQPAPASSNMHHLPNAQDSRHDAFGSDPSSPRITAMPEFPPSPGPPQSPKHGRETSKGFFSNLIASKSSHKLYSSESAIPEGVEKANARSRASSKDRVLQTVKRRGSTPELPRHIAASTASNDSHSQLITDKPTPQLPLESAQNKKNKSKLGGILSRTKTLKLDDSPPRQKSVGPAHLQLENGSRPRENVEPSPKTAPIRPDFREKGFIDDQGSAARNHSVDRHGRDESAARRERQASAMPASQSFRDGSTMQLFSNIGQTGKGMGDRLGKAGKGFLGKITRSGSSNEREHVADDNYTCTTINLPLVKQTRKTRIARRLEMSKDKTEFWMPALPWRCIEYVTIEFLPRTSC